MTPYYSDGGATIDISTGLGYPKKADDAKRHPQRLAALLRPDRVRASTGRRQVLVHGTAEVDDVNLDEPTASATSASRT